MSDTIDYYFSTNSPWTYLGHGRLMNIATRHGVAVSSKPVDFSVIFPVTGGLPVSKRAPARQAYRLSELKRWRSFLEIPLEIEPAYWPADETLAARMILSLSENGIDALPFAGAVMRAIWAENKNIADEATLLDIGRALDIANDKLLDAVADSHQDMVRKQENDNAITQGVFGAPTYIWHGELFWGQDRLEFLDRAIGRNT